MKKKLIIGFFLTQIFFVLSSTNQKFEFDLKKSQINIGLFSNKSGITFIEYSLDLFQFKKNIFFSTIGSSIIYNNLSIGIERQLVDWNQKKFFAGSRIQATYGLGRFKSYIAPGFSIWTEIPLYNKNKQKGWNNKFLSFLNKINGPLKSHIDDKSSLELKKESLKIGLSSHLENRWKPKIILYPFINLCYRL
mgnify:CR=1 FL=1